MSKKRETQGVMKELIEISPPQFIAVVILTLAQCILSVVLCTVLSVEIVHAGWYNWMHYVIGLVRYLCLYFGIKQMAARCASSSKQAEYLSFSRKTIAIRMYRILMAVVIIDMVLYAIGMVFTSYGIPALYAWGLTLALSPTNVLTGVRMASCIAACILMAIMGLRHSHCVSVDSSTTTDSSAS